MSSPSSAKIAPSSSKVTASARNTKRDVNASRSRAFGASSISNSSRMVNGAGGGSSQSTRVFLDGVDVTPQSLLVSRIKPSTSQDQRSGNKGKGGGATRRSRNTHGGGGGGGNSVMGTSAILSNASTSSLDEGSDTDVPTTSSNNSNNRSLGNATKASGAAKASVVPANPVAVTSPGSTTPAATNQNDEDDGVGPESDEAATTVAQSESSKQTKATAEASSSSSAAAANQPMPEKVRRRPITIELAETPTMMVFELRSVCVGADANHHQAVVARNRQYLEMCAQKKGSDKFVEGRSQTLQLAQKGKEVMTAPPATRDAMCVATDWDIFDWYVPRSQLLDQSHALRL